MKAITLLTSFSKLLKKNSDSSQKKPRVQSWRSRLELLESRTLLTGNYTSALISPEGLDGLADGMDGFSAWAAELSREDEFSSPINVLKQVDSTDLSLSSIVDVGDVIQQQIADPLRQHLESLDASVRTTDSLVTHLSTLAGVISVDGGFASDPTDELRFEITIQDTETIDSFAIDFGPQGAALGLSTESTTDVTMTVITDATLVFGIDLDPNLSSEQSFFLRDSIIGVSLDVDSTGSLFDGTVGLLEVAMTPDLDYSVEASVSLIDPDLSGNVTLSELNGNSLDAVAAIGFLDNTFTATFDVAAGLGSWTASGVLQVELSGQAIGALSNSTVSPDFDQLSKFNNSTNVDVADAFDLFVSWTEAFKDSQAMDIPLPFVESLGLGELVGSFDLSDTLIGVDGYPLFESFEELESVLGSAGIDYDANTQQLTLPVSIGLDSLGLTRLIDIADSPTLLSNLNSDNNTQLDSVSSVDFDLVIDLSSGALNIGDQFSVSDLTISGDITSSSTALTGSAQYGSVGIDFGDGNYSAAHSFSVDVIDPTTSNTQVSLNGLLSGLVDSEQLVDGDVVVTGTSQLDISDVLIQDTISPLVGSVISSSVADVLSGAVTLSTTNAPFLDRLADISIDDVVASLQSVADGVLSWDDGSTQSLGMLGISTQDLVNWDATSVFSGLEGMSSEFVDGTEINSPVLQDIEAMLSDYTSLSTATTSTVGGVVIDPISQTFTVTLDVIVELFDSLVDAGISVIQSATNIGGSLLDGIGEFAGNFIEHTVTSVVSELAIDISYGLSNVIPDVVVNEDTNLSTEVYINEPAASSNPLSLSGSIGVIGLALNDGHVVVAADSTTPNPSAPASFTVGLPQGGGTVPVIGFDSFVPDIDATGELLIDYEVLINGSLIPETDRLTIETTDLGDPGIFTSLPSVPAFDTIENGINLGDDLSALPGALDSLFTRLEELFDLEVFGVSLPLIGNAMTGPANFLGELRDQVTQALEALQDFACSSVETALTNIIASQFGGTVILDCTNLNDIKITLNLSAVPVSERIELNTDLGLPALGASLDGFLLVTGSYDFEVTIGVSKAFGVYLETDSESISVDLDVNYDGQLEGRLGFIQVVVTPDATPSTCANASAFHAGFGIELSDPNGDGKLTVAEAGPGPIIDHSSTGLTGCADINLFAEASAATWLPSIVTTINIDWLFDGSDLEGNLPDVTLGDVGIKLSDWLNQTIGPVIVGVDSFFDGMGGVITALAEDFPVIGKYLPDNKNSVIEVATTFFPFLKPLEYFAEILLQVSDLFDAIDVQQVDESTIIYFGDLLFGQVGNKQYDARDSQLNFDLGAQVIEVGGDSGWDRMIAELPELGLEIGHVQTSGGILDFPLFEQPLGLFEYLLGIGQAEIITYTLPSLDLSVPFDLSFPIFPLILDVGFFGDIEAFFNLTFGYDTYGLSEFVETGDIGDLLLGFYVSDTASPDGSGPDIDQFSLGGKVLAGVSAGIDKVLSAEAGGAIEANIAADLLDHDGDGKVRGDEFVSPEGCFSIEGGITVSLEASAEILFTKHTFPFAQADLASFNTIVHCSLPGFPPKPPVEQLAGLTNGRLDLYVGDLAVSRSIEPGVIDEEFTVTKNGNGKLIVSAFGATQTFVLGNVNSIHSDSGTGNDRIEISPDLAIPAELIGGDGHDTLLGGGGGDTISGDSGNDLLKGDVGIDILTGSIGDDTLWGGNESGAGDELNGGAGNDKLYGESGNDNIVAGIGFDTAYGGPGNDTLVGSNQPDVLYGDEDSDDIDGQGGNDTLFGSSGSDTLVGADGDDVLDGGPGNDSLHGDDGLDTLIGGDDDDTILGGDGTDYIEGDSGFDSLEGGNDTDTIHGGDHDDTIEGNGAADFLFGETGDDDISGQAGTDSILGGSGRDTLRGGFQDDTIFGGTEGDRIEGGWGDDSIIGEEGGDTIHGLEDPGGDVEECLGEFGTDRDTVIGGPDNDLIFGNCDIDSLVGGIGDDIIFGNDAIDTIAGGDGNDNLVGDAGDDSIMGGAGHDRIHGSVGADSIRGETGNDTVFSEDGIDTVYGDSGDDLIDGGGGDDFIDGGSGRDHIRGNLGQDLIFGNVGSDSLEGNDGADTINGNDGADAIFGNGGNDFLTGSAGKDTIRGGEDNDTIDGGLHDDLLLGHLGNDLINGDDGHDAILGHYGNDSLTGGLGDDNIQGQGGDDSLEGSEGDDVLTGGPGNDSLDGSSGRDVLYGNAGVDSLTGGEHDDYLSAGDGIGNTLMGDDGDDQLLGSDAGSHDPDFTDNILFGDLLDGGNGNDSIQGLGGADIIDAGEGDDTIEGGNHADSIVAGPDTLVVSDNDLVFGQSGDDVILGGDGDDTIEGGAGLNAIDGGGGVNEIDLMLVQPVPQLALQDAPEVQGEWSQLSDSATAGGITQVGGFEQSTYAVDGGVFVTWVDVRNGSSEVYLAYHDSQTGTWTEVGGSASEGGISDDSHQSRRPTVVRLESGLQTELLVAWTQITDDGISTIEMARHNAFGGWTRLASPSSSGFADHAILAKATAETTMIGWLDSTTGPRHVHVSYYSFVENCFSDFHPGGGDVTVAISSDIDVNEFDIAAADFRSAVIWSAGDEANRDITVLQGGSFIATPYSNLCPANPTPPAGGIRLADNTYPITGTWAEGDLVEPTATYRYLGERTLGGVFEAQVSTDLYVAWHEITELDDQVVGMASLYDFTGGPQPWEPIVSFYQGDSAPRTNADSVSDTIGYAAKPELTSSDSDVFLGWLDEGVHQDDGMSSIYILNGSGTDRVFTERIDNDASGDGISETGGAVQSLSVTVPPTGDESDAPHVVWTEARPDNQSASGDSIAQTVYLRHDIDVDHTGPNVTAQLLNGILTITGDEDDNTVFVKILGPQRLEVSGQGGTLINGFSDVVEILGVLSEIQVSTGDGDDTVRFVGQSGVTLSADVNLDLGKGHDTSVIRDWASSGSVIADMQSGNDLFQTLRSTIGQLTVEDFSGRDSIIIQSTSVLDAASLETGDGGKDRVSIRDTSFASSLLATTGKNSDNVLLRNASVVGRTTVDSGGGINNITLVDVVLDKLVVRGGTGNDRVIVGRATVSGSANVITDSGNDRFQVSDTTWEEQVLVTMGGGNDLVWIDRKSGTGPTVFEGYSRFRVGGGDDTIRVGRARRSADYAQFLGDKRGVSVEFDGGADQDVLDAIILSGVNSHNEFLFDPIIKRIESIVS